MKCSFLCWIFLKTSQTFRGCGFKLHTTLYEHERYFELGLQTFSCINYKNIVDADLTWKTKSSSFKCETPRFSTTYWIILRYSRRGVQWSNYAYSTKLVNPVSQLSLLCIMSIRPCHTFLVSRLIELILHSAINHTHTVIIIYH